MEEMFDLNSEQEKISNVYVIDSHRPFNGTNITSPKIQLLCTDRPNSEQKQSRKKNRKSKKKQRSRLEPRKKRKLDDESDEVGGEGDDHHNSNSNSQLENEVTGEGEEENELKAADDDFIEEDEEEEESDDEEEEEEEDSEVTRTYYSTSISTIMYYLAQKLNKTTNDLLWLAIIGFTDQIVHNHIETQRYKSEFSVWKFEVQALKTSAVISGINLPVNNNDISLCEEYKFMVYRHWTLYDAMYHSSYIASRLGIWRSSQNQSKLKKMLAKMGIPLTECQQPFNLMNMKVKKELPSKIHKFADQFGLYDISFPSFIKVCISSN